MIKRIIESKAFYIIASLAAALGLWLYVVGVVNPYVSDYEVKNIPVVFIGEEAILEKYNLQITDITNMTVTAGFYGKRSDLSKLDSSTVTAVVDLSSQVKRSGDFRLAYDIELPTEDFSEEVKVTSKSTDYINFYVSKIITRRIEVWGVFDGSTAEDYLAEQILLNPDYINIEGPEEDIALVSRAQVTLSRNDVDETIVAELEYTLIGYDDLPVDADRITGETQLIELTLPVIKTKEIALKIDIVEGGGATAANTVYSIRPVNKIKLAGDAKTLDEMNSIVLGTVDLSAIRETETFEFPVIIPDNTQNISGVDTVEVTVTLKSLETKFLMVRQIELINKPDGYDAESVTQYLQIEVRADASIIDNISASSVRAVADLSGYKSTGTLSVPVKVYIDGYSNAGVMDEYQIVVSVTPQSDESDDTAAMTNNITAY